MTPTTILFVTMFAECQLFAAHTSTLLERPGAAKVALPELGVKPKRAGVRSREEVLAPLPPNEDRSDELTLVDSLDIEQPGKYSLLVTVHRGDDFGYLVRFWQRSGLGYKLIHSLEKWSDPTPNFESHQLIHMRGEPLFHLTMVVPGTGFYHEDSFFWIAPDGSVHDVKFILPIDGYRGQLKEGESVMMGERNVFFDQRATFDFPIYRREDYHCCPTGGHVSGRYELRGIRHYDASNRRWSANFAIVPVDFKREPVDNSSGL